MHSFEESMIPRSLRTQRFLDALYEEMRKLGVVTTVCYERPIRDLLDKLMDAVWCEALEES